MRGFDAVVYETGDRSDSALVLTGPYHEATTWFGGRAPDAAGIGALLGTFRFTDSSRGASLVPTSDLLVKQTDTAMIGRSDSSMLMVRRAADMLPTLPDRAGYTLPGGELWRAGRVLDDRRAAQVTGTPHEWRYLLAGDSVARPRGAVMPLLSNAWSSDGAWTELWSRSERVVRPLLALTCTGALVAAILTA